MARDDQDGDGEAIGFRRDRRLHVAPRGRYECTPLHRRGCDRLLVVAGVAHRCDRWPVSFVEVVSVGFRDLCWEHQIELAKLERPRMKAWAAIWTDGARNTTRRVVYADNARDAWAAAKLARIELPDSRSGWGLLDVVDIDP